LAWTFQWRRKGRECSCYPLIKFKLTWILWCLSTCARGNTTVIPFPFFILPNPNNGVYVEKVYGTIMPRALLIRSDTHPYHVVARCNNKVFFPIPLDTVWSLMLKELKTCHEDHHLAIHAFVLMGNHFHLLCHTPKANLDQIMQRFLRQTSIKINSKRTGINHLWGNRYKWSLIQSQNHYYQVYRYIFQNPLRANICKRVEDYPYSSLHDFPIPLHSWIPFTFGGEEGELAWLNERYDKEDEDLIRLGLKHCQFDVNKRQIKAFNKLSIPKE
jgi:putative transposase